MDNSSLYPGKGSINRRLARRQTGHGCKFDDVDGILYDSVFGILKSAIKKWDRHAGWDQSDTSMENDYQHESKLEDRKPVTLPRNRNKLDNIQQQRKDLKLQQARNKDDDNRWMRRVNWDQCDNSMEHDYQQESEIQDKKPITWPRYWNKLDNIPPQRSGMKPKLARNRELDRTRANGDVSPEMINAVTNIMNKENGKRSQKTEVGLENSYLGSEGDVKELQTTPAEAQVCPEGKKCPENVRELRLSIFLNKSDFNTPIIVHINDKNSLSSKVLREGDMKSQAPHSQTTDAKLEETKPGFNEEKIQPHSSHSHTANARLKDEKPYINEDKSQPLDSPTTNAELEKRKPVDFNEDTVKSRKHYSHTTNAEFDEDRKTNFSEGKIRLQPPNSHTTNAEFVSRKRNFTISETEIKSQPPHSPSTNAGFVGRKTNFTISETEIKSQPPHSLSTNAKLEDRKTNFSEYGKGEIKSQPLHLLTTNMTNAKMEDRKAVDFNEENNKSQPPHSLTSNAKREGRKTSAVKTKVSGQKMTMCDENVPPRNVLPGDDNIQHSMPTSKLDFDIINSDRTPPKKGDGCKESIRGESVSSLVHLGSISPNNASFLDKPSKNLADTSELIMPLEMFTDKSQIRYDAIKVLAEIQMDDLKKSYQDWQNKFLTGPVHRKLEEETNWRRV